MSVAPRYGLLAIVLLCATIAVALEGHVMIHDPSTVVWCDGKLYTYGTGGSSLVSDDGWTWHTGTALPRRGLPLTTNGNMAAWPELPSGEPTHRDVRFSDAPVAASDGRTPMETRPTRFADDSLVAARTDSSFANQALQHRE